MPVVNANSASCTVDVSDLVVRSVQGEESALKALLAETYPKLCRYVGAKIPTYLRSSLDAEDIVQEAMLSVVRHIGSFEPRGPDSFDRWVTTIALRKLRSTIEYYRADKRGGTQSPVSGQARHFEDSMIVLLDLVAGSDPTPSRCVARAEAIQAMESALGQLPEADREAVRRVHLHGQSVGDAASAMGRSKRAIHGLCARARKRLRRLLKSDSVFLSGTGWPRP